MNEKQHNDHKCFGRLTPSERRREIAEIISFERFTTKARLQERFGVSKSTIKRDLRELERTGDACFYCEDGSYGGIYAYDGWYANRRGVLTPRQEEALKNILNGCQTQDDLREIEQILFSLGTPRKNIDNGNM